MSGAFPQISTKAASMPSAEVPDIKPMTLYFATDTLLQLYQGIKEGVGSRRATGDINIYRKKLIYPLYHAVGIENPAAGSAGAHGHDPLGLGHLLVNLYRHRSHLL